MFIASALAILIGDILSKRAVEAVMTLNTGFELIPGILSFTYILNDGAAYGIFAGKQGMLITLTSVVLVGMIAYAFLMRKKISAMEKLSLGLIVGGGIGNLIGRISNGMVLDFIDIHIIPVFNVADIGITVGCFLLIITVLFIEPKFKKHE
jgi:signal peptidase II